MIGWTLVAKASKCTSSVRTEIAVVINLDLLIMALFDAALKKLSKGGIINLALDYQSKFNSTLAGVRNELSDLKKSFEKLGSDLLVARQVTSV